MFPVPNRSRRPFTNLNRGNGNTQQPPPTYGRSVAVPQQPPRLPTNASPFAVQPPPSQYHDPDTDPDVDPDIIDLGIDPALDPDFTYAPSAAGTPLVPLISPTPQPQPQPQPRPRPPPRPPTGFWVFTFGPLQSKWVLNQLLYRYDPNQPFPNLTYTPAQILDVPPQPPRNKLEKWLAKFPGKKHGTVFWCTDESIFTRIKQYIDFLGPPSKASALRAPIATPAEAEAKQEERLQNARRFNSRLPPLHRGSYWWVRRSFRRLNGGGADTKECRVFLWVEEFGKAGSRDEKKKMVAPQQPVRRAAPGPSRLAVPWDGMG